MEELINFDFTTAIWCCIDQKVVKEDLEKLEAIGKIMAEECLAMIADIKTRPELEHGSMFAKYTETHAKQGYWGHAIFDALKACGTGAREELKLDEQYQAHLTKSTELCQKFRRQIHQLEYELEKLNEHWEKLDWPWRMYNNWIIYRHVLAKRTNLERVLNVTEKHWRRPIQLISNNHWGKAYRAAEDRLRQLFLNLLHNTDLPTVNQEV